MFLDNENILRRVIERDARRLYLLHAPYVRSFMRPLRFFDKNLQLAPMISYTFYAFPRTGRPQTCALPTVNILFTSKPVRLVVVL